MTPEEQNPAPLEAIRRELEAASVRYLDVFARREEIVVVLPGRGQQREQAAAAAGKVDLRGRHYLTVMAQDGAPAALKIALFVIIFAIGVFGAVLMLWGYVGAALDRGDEMPQSGPPFAGNSR